LTIGSAFSAPPREILWRNGPNGESARRPQATASTALRPFHPKLSRPSQGLLSENPEHTPPRKSGFHRTLTEFRGRHVPAEPAAEELGCEQELGEETSEGENNAGRRSSTPKPFKAMVPAMFKPIKAPLI